MNEFEIIKRPELPAIDYTIESVVEPNTSFIGGIRLLQTLFPEVSRKHIESYKEYFTELEKKEMYPDKFFFLVAKDLNDRVMGVSVFNYLDRSSESIETDRNGVIYLEYIGIHPRVSRVRLGSRLFWESVSLVINEGYKPSALIAEVVKADPQIPTFEEEMVNGRLKFFSGLGAKVLSGIEYGIPTYTHRREIPAYLIVRTLHQDVQVDLWFVRSLIYALVHDGFKYDEEISEKRAEELYTSIISSIDRQNLRLVDPLNGK